MIGAHVEAMAAVTAGAIIAIGCSVHMEAQIQRRQRPAQHHPSRKLGARRRPEYVVTLPKSTTTLKRSCCSMLSRIPTSA